MLIPFNLLFPRHRIKRNGVLHLGANTGQEAEAYARLGIRRVIWVEALPFVWNELFARVERYPGSVALLGCLSDVDGQDVTFNVANNGAQSSSFLELGTHAQEHPDVKYVQQVHLKTVRVDTLLRNHSLTVGPGWFLNVDLQGADLLALRGMGDLLHQFDHAYIEVNEKELYKGCALVGEVDEYLAQYGFSPKETKWHGKNGWGDRLYARV